MKNALLRCGYTCASILVASGLTMSGAKAEMHDLVNVTLNEPVVVGKTTLPSGRYTITSVGDNEYVIHSDGGQRAVVLGRPIDADEPAKTELVVKNDGEGTFRLDKLLFEGQTAGIGFDSVGSGR
jgi:hypothetical protein